MEHRRFLAAGTALAAATDTPLSGSSRRIGTSDIERLQRRFDEIIASDHRHGGQSDIEQKAASLADEALALQSSGTATQRVRAYVYGCAAAFRSSAMWAAIDGRRYSDAVRHMREAQALAEMAADPAIKFRIWSHAGTLYRHMGRTSEAIAANDVARKLLITRRDPMFACLGHARQAACYGLTGDATAVQRALGHAQDALDRADPGLARPAWMTAVSNGAELESLALAAHLSLGKFEQAESHAHRSLSLLRPHMQRDRALNVARLAHAQLGQDEIAPAVATAMSIPLTSLPATPGSLWRSATSAASSAPGQHPAHSPALGTLTSTPT